VLKKGERVGYGAKFEAPRDMRIGTYDLGYADGLFRYDGEDELALASLQFMPNRGAKFIANAISSAVANGGFEPEEVVVTSCRVDAGPVLKRFRPRARGTASKIRKPTSHVMVEVSKPEKKEA